MRSCRQGGAEGAALPGTLNGAFGAVSGSLSFSDLPQIKGLNFLARFAPLGPKLESLVATTVFAKVNFVEKVPGHA